MTRKVVRTKRAGNFVYVEEVREKMNENESIKYTDEDIIQIAESIAEHDITQLIYYTENGEKYIQRIEREELVEYIKRERVTTPEPLLQMQQVMENMFQGKMIIKNYNCVC